ncbi:MAG: TIGR00282 family metallophosphoesterase [Candidatus Gracilibacteria bacterium]|nr:TIGR00282 family metallophosphoesterase [Candidatus Gracilibacteria bacterium]
MKVLIFGDLFGRIGRKALIKEMDSLRREYRPDFVVVNGENVTSGRGPIEKHMKEIHDIGVDLFTSGDHFFDNEKNLLPYLERKDCKLIRPANYYESEFYTIPGKGYEILEKNGKRLLVLNLLSETFTRDHVYNPFLKADAILKKVEKKEGKLNGIIIDFHKEVASEGYGMQEFLDGRVSFIFGTHTHIQTNDDNISELGTGLISDVGMIGAKKSIIGSDYGSLKKRFLTGINKGKIEQSLDSNYIMNGVLVDIDDKTGKCLTIEKIKKFGKII